MVVEVLQPGTHCIINGDVEGLVLEVSVGEGQA